MAMTNHERVGKAMEWLRQGLAPFVERELNDKVKSNAVHLDVLRRFEIDKPYREWDAAALLKLMWETWNEVFRDTLGPAERSLVSELRDWRNKWAHQERLSSDDADRALDSVERLLTAVSAPQAAEAAKLKLELRRLVIDEQMRGEQRRVAGGLVEAVSEGGLKPWREVVTPHADVASGRYQQVEFAADLWQVKLGEGSEEYRDPGEFYRRTFSYRQPPAAAGRGRPSPRRRGRRSGGAVADQLRGRQDALHAGPVPPVLRDPGAGAVRHGRSAGGGGCRRPPGGPPRGAGGKPHLAGEPGDQG